MSDDMKAIRGLQFSCGASVLLVEDDHFVTFKSGSFTLILLPVEAERLAGLINETAIAVSAKQRKAAS